MLLSALTLAIVAQGSGTQTPKPKFDPKQKIPTLAIKSVAWLPTTGNYQHTVNAASVSYTIDAANHGFREKGRPYIPVAYAKVESTVVKYLTNPKPDAPFLYSVETAIPTGKALKADYVGMMMITHAMDFDDASGKFKEVRGYFSLYDVKTGKALADQVGVRARHHDEPAKGFKGQYAEAARRMARDSVSDWYKKKLVGGKP